jgi:hypothetical protein
MRLNLRDRNRISALRLYTVPFAAMQCSHQPPRMLPRPVTDLLNSGARVPASEAGLVLLPPGICLYIFNTACLHVLVGAHQAVQGLNFRLNLRQYQSSTRLATTAAVQSCCVGRGISTKCDSRISGTGLQLQHACMCWAQAAWR